ncbi:MAG TPA: hypothetical protein VM183_18400 [Burkholderiales bacterium]|nr:hypothetical protein [Burkholderiales bacterium]
MAVKPDQAKTDQPKTDQPKTIGLGVRLTPTGDSDQPRVANYTSVTLAPGMVFLDFGFFEPAMLAALPRVAQEGGKLPESINGRLATRVAMSYDTLANLHQQLGNALQATRPPKPA